MRKLYRRALQRLLYLNWRLTLTHGEVVRLDYWGATGNAKHHPFSRRTIAEQALAARKPWER